MDQYYNNEDVRNRLVEYAGGDGKSQPTCLFFSQCDGQTGVEDAMSHFSDLDWFLQEGKEIARSLCDSKQLLVHLDMEYVSFDSPVEAFINPQRAFEIQQPVVDVIEERLLHWGIVPLHLVTGQGHHFVWSMPLGSPTERSLAALAPVSDWMLNAYDRRWLQLPSMPDRDRIRSFHGLGLVMEYLANEIRMTAGPRTEIPVDTTAVTAGPCEAGRQREIVSLDISEYGDPINTRAIRMPFSRYLKPRRTWISGFFTRDNEIPEMFVLPLHEMDVRQALEMRYDEKRVTSLAKRVSVNIPDQAPGMDGLIADYLASPLRTFHEHFFCEDHEPEERWGHTYNQVNTELLPPCARHIVLNPNDSLLKPAGIQMVVRSLLANDWHPRQIAGYIRSRFCDPAFGWGGTWRQFDPGIRADFYTRLFAGQVATGVDRLVDFNCKSTQEKGLCVEAGIGCSLSPCCEKLNRMRRHD